MPDKTRENLKLDIQSAFGITDEDAETIIQKLDGIVTFERWESDHIGSNPFDNRLPKTHFSPVDGNPIVHSHKVSNFAINLRKIFSSSELHETLFDIFESAISPHRLIYRIVRFGATESKLTLGEVESAIYYLFWTENILPENTSDGFKKVAPLLRQKYGIEIDEPRYQSGLDKMVSDGLIEIEGDIVKIIETPWPWVKSID